MRAACPKTTAANLEIIAGTFEERAGTRPRELETIIAALLERAA
jgi:hypothetical protein